MIFREEPEMSKLMELIKNGSSIEIIQSNLAGINFDQETDSNGDTLLMVAIEIERKDVVELLLQNNTNVNISKENGMTPLMIAVINGNNEILELLIRKDAHSINDSDIYGFTALLYAIKFQYLDCVNTLIKNGADINYLNSSGTTPLLGAIQSSNIDIVNLLLNNQNIILDTPFDSSQITELMVAAALGNKRIVEALLNKGADINKKDVQRMTPLMFAVENNKKIIVELLIQKRRIG